MESQLAGGAFEDRTGRLYRQGRQRIWFGAPGFEWIRSGQPGYTQFFLAPRVIRFQIGVGNGPIGNIGAPHAAPLALLLEIRFPEPPIVARKMNGSTAHLPAILQKLLGSQSGLLSFRIAISLR